MQGKPYHKMPVSSWMIPGGNRDQKGKLIKAKEYPMKSAIQQNLGGPLSEVFFSNLAPIQQEHVGHTPKLLGPGGDQWISPSDYLVGMVVLRPPFTTRIRQALTHQGILELGAEIEEKIIKAHEIQMEAALKKKEQEMKKLAEQLIKQAILADRQAQAAITNHMLESAQQHLSTTYQEILTSTVDEIMHDAVQRMEDAVNHTRRVLEQELCGAVESHRHHLGKQYELQVAWLHNQLFDKYENILKKQGQKCTQDMEEIRKQCEFEVKRNFAHIQAEHITDLVVQACEKSKKHHEEKKHLEHNFGAWFVNNFEAEIVNRDFTILELEDTIRKLEAQSQRREDQLKEFYRHFQKFITYALHEKPGQAEFLLSLEKELKILRSKVEVEEEGQFIARTILDFILKCISEKATNEAKKEEVRRLTNDNFREVISDERSQNRVLALVGEAKSSQTLKDHSSSTDSKIQQFKSNQLESLVNLFQRNPSALKMIQSLSEMQLKEVIGLGDDCSDSVGTENL